MCKFLSLEFDGCGHERRTEAVIKCDALEFCPIYGRGQKPNIKALASRLFEYEKLPGCCLKCTIASTRQELTENKELQQFQLQLDKMRLELDLLKERSRAHEEVDKVVAAKQREKESQASGPEEQLDSNMEKMLWHRRAVICGPFCAVDDCDDLVVEREGASGSFCEIHTCYAADWGCLQDNLPTKQCTSTNGKFCTDHTCRKRGCEKRISGSVSPLCKEHRQMAYRIMMQDVQKDGLFAESSRSLFTWEKGFDSD